MKLKTALAAFFVFGWSTSVFAQAPAPSDASPSAGGSGSAAASGLNGGKREACKRDVAGKKLRGPERADAMQICMAEARLDCVKEAVAKKTPRSERKAFIKSCVGGKGDHDEKSGDKQDD